MTIVDKDMFNGWKILKIINYKILIICESHEDFSNYPSMDWTPFKYQNDKVAQQNQCKVENAQCVLYVDFKPF